MAFLGRTGTMVAAASIGGVVERVAVDVLHRGGGSRRCPAPGRAGVLNLGRPERERCARLRPNSYYLISFVLQSGAVSLSRARVDGVAVPRVGQYSGSRNRRNCKGCSPGGWSGERAAVPGLAAGAREQHAANALKFSLSEAKRGEHWTARVHPPVLRAASYRTL